MKKKLIPLIMAVSLSSLCACGHDEVGQFSETSADSVSVNSGETAENPPETSTETTAETTAPFRSTAKTEITSASQTTTETASSSTVSSSAKTTAAVNTSAAADKREAVTETRETTANTAQDPQPVYTEPQTEKPTEKPTEPTETAPPPTVHTETVTKAAVSEEAPSSSDGNYGAAPQVYSDYDITYINGILIANKSYSLPSDFNPGLDPDCQEQFGKLCAGAAADGLYIYLSSGFRSYSYQDEIYSNYVYQNGQATADTFSARPGHSEHQSGLAIDVNIIDDSFIGTPEAEWIEKHCYEYGFILRYPKGKQDITGYKYEPWHIRYVGTDVSYALHNAAVAGNDPYLTLEEYLGIDSYYH